MSIWILSRTAPLLLDGCILWNPFLSPELVGVWALLAHNSWVQLLSKYPGECQEGTGAAQWCSETGARPQNWELLQHCPFLTAPQTAVLLNKVLTQAQVKSRQKFHQFQSKLHFTSTDGAAGRPHRNPDIGKLRDFSWQVQPCWASSATPARCKQTYFPWKTEAEDT